MPVNTAANHYLPSGERFLWDQGLLSLHAVSDILIGLSLLVIPIYLIGFAKKRQDIVPAWVLHLFAIFLFLCGMQSFLSVLDIWVPNYWLSGGIKALAAIFSLTTAFALRTAWPGLLALPSPASVLLNEKKISRIYRFLNRTSSARGTPVEEVQEKVEQIEDYVVQLAKEKRDLEKENIAQSTFLTNMSHEIRTPLSGIIGYADQLLAEPGLGEEQREGVIAIKRCGNHLKMLINDILDLSRIEAGDGEIRKIDFNLQSLLNELSSIMDLRIQGKDLKFRIHFQTLIPEWIKSDPLRLRQILINLLGNAAKFTDKGLVSLEIAAKGFCGQGEGELIFTVIDTGCGIPEQFHGDLFKRFSQADPSLSRKLSGSGLGLHLSRNLVRHLGGDLTLVESRPDEGSTFRFVIKAEKVADSRLLDEYLPPPSFHEEAIDLKGMEGLFDQLKILLVEDGVDNQRIFSYFLRMAGATVIIEKDGGSAMQRIQSETDLDIILMDIQLPVMDGYTLTAQLRKQGFRKPIIAVTAHALPEERERCLAIGFSDYLSKPLEIKDLIQAVATHTGRAMRKVHKTFVVPANSTYEQNDSVKEVSVFQDCGSDDVIVSKHINQPLYRDLLTEFIGGLDKRMTDMRGLIEEKRWDDLGSLMHQIKGAAATYGYPSLSEAAGRIEDSVPKIRVDSSVEDSIVARASSMQEVCRKIEAGRILLENKA